MALIVGYDPGKNFALTLIDVVSGDIIAIISEKNKNLNFIIKKIIQFGNPIIVGYDKKNLNKNVKELSRKLGLVMIHPKSDLKIQKKKRLVKEFIKNKNHKIIINNKHEFDSLANAIYAYKKIMPLINKLKNEIKKPMQDLEYALLKIIKNEKNNIKEIFKSTLCPL